MRYVEVTIVELIQKYGGKVPTARTLERNNTVFYSKVAFVRRYQKKEQK
jgi:hypothetical protein